jgi:oligopeptide transport system substrate-binding protein
MFRDILCFYMVLGMRIPLFFLLFITLFGCQKAPAPSNKITVNLRTEPSILNPTLATDMTSMNVLIALFEGLTRFDEKEKPQPALAKKIEISDDLLTYTFHLRESTWSNGEPLTSKDFFETWSLVLTPSYPAPFAYKFYDIKNAERINKGELPVEELGIETPDPQTLIVHLERPTPQFLDLLTLPTFFPLPVKHIKAHPDWAGDAGPLYISNGPFYLSQWVHEDHIRLKKSPSYWDAGAVRLENIEMLMINDPTTEYAMFEVGEIQWTGLPLSSLPTDVMVDMKKQGKLNTIRANAVEFLLLNTEAFPLNNVHIRHALSYAINRQELIDHVTQNDQQPALSLTPPSLTREALVLFQDHDLEEAKNEFKLGLKELGLTYETFPKLSYLFNTSQDHKRIAEVMQMQWLKVLGVHTSLENADWKLYIPKLIQGDFQIARMGWVGEYRDPMAFLYIFASPPDDGINLSRFDDAPFKEWMKKAKEADTYKKREQALIEAEKRLIDQMPLVPLYYSNMAYLKSPRLKGVHVNSLYVIDFKEANLEP